MRRAGEWPRATRRWHSTEKMLSTRRGALGCNPFPKAPDGAGARRSGWLPTAMTATAAGVSGGVGAAAGATSEREGTADTDDERVALGLSYNGS